MVERSPTLRVTRRVPPVYTMPPHLPPRRPMTPTAARPKRSSPLWAQLLSIQTKVLAKRRRLVCVQTSSAKSERWLPRAPVRFRLVVIPTSCPQVRWPSKHCNGRPLQCADRQWLPLWVLWQMLRQTFLRSMQAPPPLWWLLLPTSRSLRRPYTSDLAPP